MTGKLPLRPRLAGEFWLIGASPVLPEFPDAGMRETGANARAQPECVDHHLYQGSDGAWHLWGCIRRTAVGRILYHWEGSRLDEGPWRATGEYYRADRAAGESLEGLEGQEWIQSPFFVKAGGLYYMFYGGHGTGTNRHGRPVLYEDPGMECQICLMTSTDGRHWVRFRNADGYSRVFAGPGEVRDPCVVMIAGTWHMYYAGYHDDDRDKAGIYLRTSADLLHWSDWRLVHAAHQIATGRWSHECPHVVERGGRFYLFRTEDYATARTHVFCSDNPRDFGVGAAADEKYLGELPVAAPEIIFDASGQEYITSNHDLRLGTQLCRLTWE